MAEMLIQSESLTSIADKIRVLSGTEGAMSLDDMEGHVGEANDDVATEADLIAQINTALEGKAINGVETCTIRVEFDGRPSTSSDSSSLTKYMNEGIINISYIDSTGIPCLEPWDNFVKVSGTFVTNYGYWDVVCQCNSLIAIQQQLCRNDECDGYTYSDDMTLLASTSYSAIFKTPSQSGEYNFKWHVASHSS